MTNFIKLILLSIGILFITIINLGAQHRSPDNVFFYRNSLALIDTKSIASSQGSDGTLIANSPSRAKNSKLLRTDADSNKKENRIAKVWRGMQEQYHIKVDVKDNEPYIRLSVYNMLGKEVLLIYSDKPKPKDVEYTFSGSELPNGVYICVLQGKNFRDAEKFIVSR